MRDLKLLYEDMYQHARTEISSGRFTNDITIDDPGDNRFGLILNIPLSDEVKQRIFLLQQKFAAVEPEQYYYPQTDLHITAMAIVSCKPAFSIVNLDLNAYEVAIRKALEDVRPFTISCSGVTAFPGGIIMQGFPSGAELNTLRNNLRAAFQSCSLFNTIDSRYRIETAHSTVVRFRKPLVSANRVVEMLDTNRKWSFGVTSVESVELVYGDWFQKREKTKILKVFNLQKHVP